MARAGRRAARQQGLCLDALLDETDGAIRKMLDEFLAGVLPECGMQRIGKRDRQFVREVVPALLRARRLKVADLVRANVQHGRDGAVKDFDALRRRYDRRLCNPCFARNEICGNYLQHITAPILRQRRPEGGPLVVVTDGSDIQRVYGRHGEKHTELLDASKSEETMGFGFHLQGIAAATRDGMILPLDLRPWSSVEEGEYTVLDERLDVIEPHVPAGALFAFDSGSTYNSARTMRGLDRRGLTWLIGQRGSQRHLHCPSKADAMTEVFWDDADSAVATAELEARLPLDRDGEIPTWDSAKRRRCITVVRYGKLRVRIRAKVDGEPYERDATLIVYNAEKATRKGDRARLRRRLAGKSQHTMVLLVSDVDPDHRRCLELIEAYLLRFQVEQAFRLSKSKEGLAIEQIQVRRWERTVNLIAVVALLAFGLLGYVLRRSPELVEPIVARAAATGRPPLILAYRILAGLQWSLNRMHTVAQLLGGLPSRHRRAGP